MPAVYDQAVTEGLVVLWEASDHVCGKVLKAFAADPGAGHSTGTGTWPWTRGCASSSWR